MSLQTEADQQQQLHQQPQPHDNVKNVVPISLRIKASHSVQNERDPYNVLFYLL